MPNRADIRDDELLSCPFCGKKPQVEQRAGSELVACRNYLCSVQPLARDSHVTSARESWNTRHLDE